VPVAAAFRVFAADGQVQDPAVDLQLETLGSEVVRVARRFALDEALHRLMRPLLQQPSAELLQHRYDRFRYIDSLIQAEPHFGPKID